LAVIPALLCIRRATAPTNTFTSAINASKVRNFVLQLEYIEDEEATESQKSETANKNVTVIYYLIFLESSFSVRIFFINLPL
jgi:hypothetical protein